MTLGGGRSILLSYWGMALRYFTALRRACQPEKRVNDGMVDMEKAGYYNLVVLSYEIRTKGEAMQA